MAPVIAVKSSEFKHDAVHSFFPSRFVPTEAEHGYASPLPMPDDLRNVTKRPKTKKSQGNRWARTLASVPVLVHHLSLHHANQSRAFSLHCYFHRSFFFASRTTHNELEKNRWVRHLMFVCLFYFFCFFVLTDSKSVTCRNNCQTNLLHLPIHLNTHFNGPLKNCCFFQKVVFMFISCQNNIFLFLFSVIEIIFMKIN